MTRLSHCPNPACGISLRGEPMDPKYFEHDLTSQEHLDSIERNI